MKKCGPVPTRLVVGVMICFTCWINYMYRVNMSLNIIAMVPAQSNTTSIRSECEELEANQSSRFQISRYSEEYNYRSSRTAGGSETFDWTAQEQGYILSGYFWGYLVTNVLGGPMTELVGIRNLMFSTQLLCAVLTILSPWIARIHYLALMITRVVQGLSSGPHFAALQMLVAHWAPPEEKGLFVSGLLAGALGTVATWTLTAPIIDNYGWEYGFYAPGGIALIWSFMFLFLVYDSPVVHPRISASEKEYILSKIGNKVQHGTKAKKVVPPLKSILTSGPFWALMVLHYGNAWGFYFMMTAAPKYVSDALGFNISSTGILASVPYLARWSFCVIFGAIGDAIMKRKLMTTTAIRKFFVIFSHVIPSVMMVSLGYVGCSPILSIFIITFALACNGAVTLTNFANSQDLAPNYAGTIFGIVNGIGSTAGVVTPLITAHFTKDGNGFAEWRPVFMLGAAVYFAGAAYFTVFGTGELQKWNDIVAEKEQKVDKENEIVKTDKI